MIAQKIFTTRLLETQSVPENARFKMCSSTSCYFVSPFKLVFKFSKGIQKVFSLCKF